MRDFKTIGMTALFILVAIIKLPVTFIVLVGMLIETSLMYAMKVLVEQLDIEWLTETYNKVMTDNELGMYEMSDVYEDLLIDEKSKEGLGES